MRQEAIGLLSCGGHGLSCERSAREQPLQRGKSVAKDRGAQDGWRVLGKQQRNKEDREDGNANGQERARGRLMGAWGLNKPQKNRATGRFKGRKQREKRNRPNSRGVVGCMPSKGVDVLSASEPSEDVCCHFQRKTNWMMMFQM